MAKTVERVSGALDPLRKLRERGRDLPAPARFFAFVVVSVALVEGFNAVLPHGLPLGIVIRGLVYGCLYSLLAMGVVLIYRANRVLNFAQAEFGAVAAVLAIEFVITYRWNYFLAIITGLAIATVTGALVNMGVIRRFRRAPRLIVAVATIGIAYILNAMSIIIPILLERGVSTHGFTTPFSFKFTIYP